jgi:hypothetical protein
MPCFFAENTDFLELWCRLARWCVPNAFGEGGLYEPVKMSDDQSQVDAVFAVAILRNA